MRSVEKIKADMAKPCDYTDKCELTAELILALTRDISLDRLEELCAAEKDGRVDIRLCKIGERIYTNKNGFAEYEVTGITEAVCVPLTYQAVIIESDFISAEEEVEFEESEVGKTIFLPAPKPKQHYPKRKAVRDGC